MNIQNCHTKPKSKSIVVTKCYLCSNIRNIVFGELIRSTNKHIILGLSGYCCKNCLIKSDVYIERSRQKSIAAKDKITKGASERSKRLWQQDDYKEKMARNHDRLSKSSEFASKVSKAVGDKFKNDHEYVERVNAARFNNQLEFLCKCGEVHDGLYNYSKAVYVGVDKPFVVVCRNHGKFEQLPSNHIKGHGCPQCAIDRSKLSQDEFFKKCSKIHKNKYDYSKSNYLGSLLYITYVCQQHGEITQLAQNHLKGAGCRFCSASKHTSAGENEIFEHIKSLCPEAIANDRIVLDGQEIDILLKSLGIGVEYHGLYWHSYNMVETNRQRNKHFHKLNNALNKGILLIQVYENEWVYKQKIVKSMLSAKLGFSSRLYARNCKIKKLSNTDAEQFFTQNHLNGHRKAKSYIGLEHDGEIVVMASFTSARNKNELIRFCSKLGYTVVGGLSRLIKHSGYTNVFTYADRRYSPVPTGYLSSGFKLVGITKPGYSYCRGLKLYSRQMFQKHKLSSKLANFDPSLTEAENMFNHGYRRIWDAGHYKLEWKNEN